MINISWKDGFLFIENNSDSNQYDEFEIIFGERENPFLRLGFNKNFNYSLYYKFYIEYNIFVYGVNKSTNVLDFITSKQFNCNNQNLLFELDPRTQTESDIWISYLENFSYKKNFIPFCILPDSFSTNSEVVKRITQKNDLDFYSKYKICWEQDYFINPRGWLNLSSFELINNALFKI